ncbi:unnamed protein product [Cuscuta campestris]|uniref:40S ribosomal protein SA n=1 Tax=Cuscuta campestris TaxID=132261 RepID=A0A484LE22_9ASTE|nr:unnamed protein product [Cuscuta campestris]
MADTMTLRILGSLTRNPKFTVMAHTITLRADLRRMYLNKLHLVNNEDDRNLRYAFYFGDDVVFNLVRTWEKTLLAARAVVAIDDPKDIVVLSARPFAHKAVSKFAEVIGATVIADGRRSPKTFAQRLHDSSLKPCLLIVADPTTDRLAIQEAFLADLNIPVIALCGSDSSFRHVDIAIPANNKSKQSIGYVFWLFARMVLQIRGEIPQGHMWPDVPVEQFVCDDRLEEQPEEEEKVPELELLPVPDLQLPWPCGPRDNGDNPPPASWATTVCPGDSEAELDPEEYHGTTNIEEEEDHLGHAD